jgi:hypothetical protein
MRTPSRILHKVQIEGQRVFVRFLASARNENVNKSIQILVALTLCAMRFNFALFKPG